MSTTTIARCDPRDRLAVQDHHLQRHADGLGRPCSTMPTLSPTSSGSQCGSRICAIGAV